MKRLLSFCLVIALVISTASFSDAKKLPEDNAKIEILFTRKLDFNDIVKIKLDLSQKGMVLNYKELGFDKEGKLKSISFHVDCKDGFSGGATGELNYQSRFGFFRDYSKNSNIPFATGDIPPATSK